MADRQQALAQVILQDPAVESCRPSSASTDEYDGHSGRIQINLKPLEERHVSASDIIRRLQRPPAWGHSNALSAACRT